MMSLEQCNATYAVGGLQGAKRLNIYNMPYMDLTFDHKNKPNKEQQSTNPVQFRVHDTLFVILYSIFILF